MKNISIESTTPVYTLGVASTLTGIPVHSIRQYIDKGLIIPFRKESSHKLFSQVDIIRLKYIQKLLDEGGLNIAGIRALLAVVPCWVLQKCSSEDREKCQVIITNLSANKTIVQRNTNRIKGNEQLRISVVSLIFYLKSCSFLK